MKSFLALFVVALLLIVPGAADAKGVKVNRKAFMIIDDYNNAVRWGEWGKAWEYVDPVYRADHPLTELELKRFEMVKITEVTEKASNTLADGSTDKLMVIHLAGKFTQVERTITDRQHWRWDAKTKRYWLMTGLPDITAED